MTPRVPETDQISWVAWLAIQTLNAVGLLLMLVLWPALALADLLRRPATVIVTVAPEHLPVQTAPYQNQIRAAA